MSTRATIHFKAKGESKPEAIIYRHGDGYPEEPGLGQDLQRFIADLKANVPDNRFSDPSHLAAKWVVWDAANHQSILLNAGVKTDSPHRCNFLSVGVCRQDPMDIQYRYTVTCDREQWESEPTITCQKGWGKRWTDCEIPQLKTEKQNA